MLILSSTAARQLSAVWRGLNDDGAGDAFVELYSGELPRSPDDPAPRGSLACSASIGAAHHAR